MQSTSKDIIKIGKSILLRKPNPDDQDEFIKKVIKSRKLHRPWLYPPDNPEKFKAYLSRCQAINFLGLFACTRQTAELAGVINLSEIVRGPFQSAYLGIYALCPSEGKGYMREALQLTLDYCFKTLGLHRLEANIQPGNEKSKGLVQRCGFHKEGYSPNYLKIGGKWRDHERWAILANEWQEKRKELSTKL